MSISILKKYEQINKSIKNEISLSFNEFKAKKNINIIPLKKNSLKNDINRESKPIISLMKNNIKLGLKKSHSQIDFFKYKNHNLINAKNNLFKIKTKINEINNKIILLIKKNNSKLILVNNSKNEYNKYISKLNTKGKNFLEYYEKMYKDISTINNNKSQIIKFFKENENLRDNNNASLRELKNKMIILFSKNGNIKKNKISEKCNKFNDIDTIKTDIENIKKNLNEIKENEKYNQILSNLKLIINRSKIKLKNDIINNINYSKKENKIIIKEIINNLNKLNYLKNNIEKYIERANELEKEIINLRMNLMLKNEFENINNIKNNEIFNLDQKQILLNYELESLTQKVNEIKKFLSNFTYKFDFYNFIKNLESNIKEAKIKFSEKIKTINEHKNYYKNLILLNIETRKKKLNNFEKEKNNINYKLFEIQSIIERNNNNNDNYSKDILSIQKNYNEFNNILQKLYKINININTQSDEINNFNQKFVEIGKRINSEPFNNLTKKKTLKKSISTYIFEEKKYMNEINIHKIINKKRRNDLIIHLKNIITNLINKKNLIKDQMNNFINKQDKINRRNEDQIKYNNEIINLSKIENLKKLKSFKDIIYNVVEKYIKINRIHKINSKKINDTKELLNQKEDEISQNCEDIKSYLKEKIKNLEY